jgi:hypothetical protein
LASLGANEEDLKKLATVSETCCEHEKTPVESSYLANI